MRIDFYKYQGAGNDFVIVDDRAGIFKTSKDSLERLCDRRFGIGADGVIVLQKAEGYDFRMKYYNADGNEGSMCGNGGRCVVRFAHDLGIFTDETRFIAFDGPHTATVREDVIDLKMGDVNTVEQKGGDTYFLNTGSPHYVDYVTNLDEVDVVNVGRNIRYGAEYGPQGGTNVNFVEVKGENRLAVRTYERGVEDETYACGTGVTACALTASLKFGWLGPVTVQVKGGELQVSFRRVQGEPAAFADIYLTGPATFVFRGDLEV